MFKIAPLYVKNGTLDGYVGFQKDKDYANELVTGERGSYFKPLEAYALKSLIAREQHQIEAYYKQFDAGAIGQGRDISNPSRNLGNLLLNLPGNDSLSPDEWKAQVARRSLVNTSVWDSDRGRPPLFGRGAGRRRSRRGGFRHLRACLQERFLRRSQLQHWARGLLGGAVREPPSHQGDEEQARRHLVRDSCEHAGRRISQQAHRRPTGRLRGTGTVSGRV